MFQSIPKHYNNLPCCDSRVDFPSCKNTCSLPGMGWEWELLTPPLSPEQNSVLNNELPTVDTFTNVFNSPSTSSVDELLNSSFALDFPSVLPDLRDTCTEVFEFESQQIDENSTKIFSRPTSKDCMWNGRGIRPKCYDRQSSRSVSPFSPICTPENGCVDPRFVFNHLGTSPSPGRLKSPNGHDSPSESDEEVDVVTVDKKLSPQKQQATVGVLSEGGKVVGTLVQKKNGTHPPQLTLVTTGRNLLKGVNANQQVKNTCKIKKQTAVSMLINNGNGSTKTVNVQLKCVPITNSLNEIGKKRKVAVSGEPRTVVQLMRLTPTSQSVKSEESKEISLNGKKRFVSLDGISMVSNTGINRVRSDERNDFIKSEPANTEVEVSSISSKNANLVNAEKKKAKRFTKRTLSVPYDSPTSSPGSVNEDTLLYPKRKSPGARSGAQEEEVRAYHNVLERQRRESLRFLYHDLRIAVPDVKDIDKAPKVAILTKAKEYVSELRKQTAELALQKKAEQIKHNQLKLKLNKLASEITKVGSMSSYTNCPVKREIPNSQSFAVYVK